MGKKAVLQVISVLLIVAALLMVTASVFSDMASCALPVCPASSNPVRARAMVSFFISLVLQFDRKGNN